LRKVPPLYSRLIPSFSKLWSGVVIARPYALGSHSYCKISV